MKLLLQTLQKVIPSITNVVVTMMTILFANGLFAQDFSNKGRDFWVGFGHHQYMESSCDGTAAGANDMNMILYFVAEQPAIVTVSIDSADGTGWSKTYSIPANTVIVSDRMPKGPTNAGSSGTDPNFDARLYTNPAPMGPGSETLFRKKGIHIVSNTPISAFAKILGGVTSSATMLLPEDTWGYAYTCVNSEQRDADKSYSWLYVIASENNTLVEINPMAMSRNGKPANVPLQIVMQKGQIYQYLATGVCLTGIGAELTGTTVKSLAGADGRTHPVAVFTGSSRTGGETLFCGTGSGRDNDIKQMMPENTWGTRYVTAPFSKSQGTTLQPSVFQTSVFKVVVKDPATIVRRNGVTLSGLINNKYYKFSSVTADYIEADKPVMVAQFMSGTSVCNGGSGDPEMIPLVSSAQATTKAVFPRSNLETINSNYVTLIVRTQALSSLRIDNSSVFNHVYPHPNIAGYSVVVKGWGASALTSVVVTCDSAFTAISYGLGVAESYGFNTGVFIKDFYRTTAPTCAGSSVYFTAGNPVNGNTYQWQVDTGTGYIDIANSSVYSGTATDTLLLTTPPTAWHGYTYRCIKNGFPFNMIYPLKFTLYWMGGVSSDWDNPGNWSCNTIPGENTEVIINSGLSRYPFLILDGVCGSLTLMPGSSVNIMPGVNLDVKRKK